MIVGAILVVFFLLYIVGGDTIVFFRKKKRFVDEKAGQTTKKMFSFFADRNKYTQLGPVTLAASGLAFEFDSLIVGTFGILAARAMPYIGDIYTVTDVPGRWLHVLVTENGTERQHVPDMYIENTEATKLLRDIINAEKLTCPVVDVALMVTGGKGTQFFAKKDTYITPQSVRQFCEKTKYLADNKVNVEKVLEALAKYTAHS